MLSYKPSSQSAEVLVDATNEPIKEFSLPTNGTRVPTIVPFINLKFFTLELLPRTFSEI